MRINFFNKKKNGLQRGFSLAEMVVVAGIFVVITSVALLRQSKFSSDILVTNVAYEVALSIREAQVYGISSRQGFVNEGDGDVLRGFAFGIHFDASQAKSFQLFADKPELLGNGEYEYDYLYSADYGDQIISENTLSQGHEIARFCAYKSSNNKWSCSDDNSNPLDFLDISFLKPKPEAQINDNQFNKAIIVVKSSLGDKCRTIKVTKVGQIEVMPVIAENSCDVINDDQ